MQLYFMRHGQSNYNLLKLCNDDPGDAVHLTELGRQQAERAAQQMANVPLERIFASELPRARQTAEIVACGRHLSVITRPELNDIRTGMNQRSVAEYQAAIAHDPMHTRVNGGESLLDHKRRVTGFLQWLQRQPWQAVLAVAHEETLRVVSAYFDGLSEAQMLKLTFDNAQVLRYES